MTPNHPEIIQITSVTDWFYADENTVLPVAVFALTRDGAVLGMVRSARGAQLEVAPSLTSGLLLERHQLTAEQEKTANAQPTTEEVT